jgi:hypothetical protein
VRVAAGMLFPLLSAIPPDRVVHDAAVREQNGRDNGAQKRSTNDAERTDCER